MLELDPDLRITAEQALAHKYLAQYADPLDEPISAPYDQSFEDMELPVEKWKGILRFFSFLDPQKCLIAIAELVYEEVCNFVPHQIIATQEPA